MFNEQRFGDRFISCVIIFEFNTIEINFVYSRTNRFNHMKESQLVPINKWSDAIYERAPNIVNAWKEMKTRGLYWKRMKMDVEGWRIIVHHHHLICWMLQFIISIIAMSSMMASLLHREHLHVRLLSFTKLYHHRGGLNFVKKKGKTFDFSV